jgi:RNase P/RNase MRP subunit p29
VEEVECESERGGWGCEGEVVDETASVVVWMSMNRLIIETRWIDIEVSIT